jgi:radical SAM superfamily enzyme YgiQ (UPF0313 family)
MSEIVLFTGVNNLVGFCRYAGTYRLATELRDAGFSVQTVDFFGEMSPQDVHRVIDAHVGTETLWVGISTTLMQKYLSDEEEDEFWEVSTSVELNLVQKNTNLYGEFLPYDESDMQDIFEHIKENNPKTQIVVGGYKALAHGKPWAGVDYWIAGQGEGPAVALSNYLKHKTPLQVLDCFMGKILTDKMYPFYKFNNARIKWHKSDHILPNEDLPIEFARGCIFKCSFCAFPLNGKKFGDYTRGMDSLREELIYNYENYGTTGYMVSDDTINDSMKKVKYLHEVFTSLPFKARLTGYLRLDIIAAHPEMIPMLNEIGVSSVNFGIETFNQHTGKIIGKGADPEKLKKCLYDLKEAWGDDVFTSANFIIGLPEESKESVRSTFDWLHQEDVPLHGTNLTKLYIAQYPTRIDKPDLITEDQMRKYGFVKSAIGQWEYNTTSKIQDNPEDYSISFGEEFWFKWKSEYMTEDEAQELSDEFYSDPRSKHLKQNFIYPYSRLINMGYKKEDILKLDRTHVPTLMKLLKETRKLRDEYVEKVCTHNTARSS